MHGKADKKDSLSLINRELLDNFNKKGIKAINIENIENWNSGFSDNKAVILTHSWPPCFEVNRFGDIKKSIILPWEYQRIPKQWVKPLNDIFDKIFVPTHFVRKALIKSGVSGELISVIPNGINHEIFNSKPVKNQITRSSKKIKFLFVGGTIWRKGIDILLEAYLKAFDKKDDVALIIKDFGSDSFYQGQNHRERILSLIRSGGIPEIIYIDKYLNEVELSDLYKESSCLILPYRGEGFGLPVLEAVACGTPVIVPRGGATDDFCNDDVAFFIDTFSVKNRFKGLNLTEEKVEVNVPKIDSLAL